METWVVSTDQATATVTGRVLQPWSKKINLIWWFGNLNEPWPPDWYLPGQVYWKRTTYWYLRNPLENFSNYVVGVVDRNYTVSGTSPVTLTAWNDLPGGRTGWKYSVIALSWLRLPFVSYTGKYLLFYAGWQYGGFFGLKLNILNSNIQWF